MYGRDGPAVASAAVATEGHSFGYLLDSLEQEESGGDADAVCPNGCCVGAYQLTKIYVDDANRILDLYRYIGERFTYEDRWDKHISRVITTVVTCYYANYDWQDKPHTKMEFLETAARTHKNPNKRNHPDTGAYWQLVKARLEAK